MGSYPSADTYSASKPGPNGTTTQNQALIGFIDGQPSYNDTKARMPKVANGDTPPKATRSGLPVPKSNLWPVAVNPLVHRTQ
jgi:hypothetical protein